MNNGIEKLTTSSYMWAWGNWTVSSVKYSMGEFKGVHHVMQHRAWISSCSSGRKSPCGCPWEMVPGGTWMWVQFQAGAQCVRKLGCSRAKWAVLGVLGQAECHGLCLSVCTWAALIWQGLCVCNVSKCQPLVNTGALQWENPGCVLGDPWGKWNFSLPQEMGVPAGEPHGAAPHCQCRNEGEVVVRGEVAPPPTCQIEIGGQPSFVLCV